ncbi:hypothetical protein [Micromonospora taraxaci]
MATHNPWAMAVRKFNLKRFDSYPAELGMNDGSARALSHEREVARANDGAG